MVFCKGVVLYAGNLPKLAFNKNAFFMSVVTHFFCQRHILLKRQGACIDHHRVEAKVDSLFANFKGFSVIEVQKQGSFARLLDKFRVCHHKIFAHIFKRAF